MMHILLQWYIWAPITVLLPYHVLNLTRIIAHRIHPHYIRNVSLRTTVWIVGAQALLVLVSVIANVHAATLITTLGGLEAGVSIFFLYHMASSWRRTRITPTDNYLSDSQLPSLSVLVPARNETLDLQNCLEALVQSDYPKLEIIALDDCSADRRTPEIIRGFAHNGVRFVPGDEPPSHMLPKNYAYARLAEEASGELLVFMGVDVILEPDSLRRIVETLLSQNRDMVSILPLRPTNEHQKLNFLQAMRYWWELGFPRRVFNRPPVLSSLWVIRRDALDKAGGFAAAGRMITPEAFFARKLVASDGYIFVRSTPHTIVAYSTKDLSAQFETAIRVRYPQLHHRIELVLLVSLFETTFFILPFALLAASVVKPFSPYVIVCSLISVVSISVMYYFIGIRTHLNNIWLGLLTAPVAFIVDIFVMHISMWQYEFGKVIWHDRNIARPMQQVEHALPPVDPIDRTGAVHYT